MLVCLPRVLFLNAASIRQHHLTQVFCPWRAEDAAFVALSGQPGKVADMVQVGVCEHDRIEAAWRDGEFVPVSQTKLFQPLKQPTVEQNPSSIVLEKVFGTCDGACRTKKCEFRHVMNDDIRVFRICPRSCRVHAGAAAVLLCPSWGSALLSWLFRGAFWRRCRTLDAQVGSRRLTIDDIYNPTRRINFSGTPETNITWLDPATYLTRRRGAGGSEWLKVDAQSGSHVAAVRRQCHGDGTRVTARRHSRRGCDRLPTRTI